MHLSREKIITTALELLDEYGLPDMTMRRLATQLGAAPGAVYWHFKNKQALIDATARAILEPFLSDQPGTPHQRCTDLRELMLAHRDGAELVSTALTDPNLRRDVIDHLDSAPTVAHSALFFTLGFVSIEQAERQRAGYENNPDSELMDKDAATAQFDACLRAIACPHD